MCHNNFMTNHTSSHRIVGCGHTTVSAATRRYTVLLNLREAGLLPASEFDRLVVAENLVRPCGC